MVSDMNRSKNVSKLKSPKSSSRSRRNKLSISREHQRTKSPFKKDSEIQMNKKIKSGSWKRTTSSWNLSYSNTNLNESTNLNSESTFPSLSTTAKFRSESQPSVLYSDVLFNGEKLKTPVKIKNLTPRHCMKLKSRSLKRLISVDKILQKSKSKEREESNRRLRRLKKITSQVSVEAPSVTITTKTNDNAPKSSVELDDCVNKLMKHLNINIQPWNFEDYNEFDDGPDEYINRFDDYNYLACENVALAGLRLATDGKFRI
ncbi:uncharacterized protein LOC129952822 [Eupeodes corollae]|uniref:uncharacterized protein LOC129952822 n=1 Tax=Eupeodes corollae TaxID=290404 RepID=UPI00249367F0|nr:uncharacterized protein LOC129952822 [Eupeodes corollae]